MNSWRLRRVLDGWWAYTYSNPVVQKLSGGWLGRESHRSFRAPCVHCLRGMARGAGVLRAELSKIGVEPPHAPPDVLTLPRSIGDRSTRETSVRRIQGALDRRRVVRRRGAGAPQHMTLMCGSRSGATRPDY